jgi:hypothetical protein
MIYVASFRRLVHQTKIAILAYNYPITYATLLLHFFITGWVTSSATHFWKTREVV